MASNHNPAPQPGAVNEPPRYSLPVSPLSTTASLSRERGDSTITLNTSNHGHHPPEVIFAKDYSGPEHARHDRYRIFGRWKWELSALGLALGVLVAIAVLMREFNGQDVPDWGYAINLSTLLALLATIFRSAIVAIMAQIISQIKWAGYMTGAAPRPLQDLQHFDSASRNVIGAAALIPKVLVHNPLATMAAIITIASLAVGPMVQQSVRTADCALPAVVNRTGASIPYARFVPRRAGYVRVPYFDQYGLEYKVKDGIRFSLTRPTDEEQRVNPSLQCSTGNCTFPGGDPVEDRGNLEFTGNPLSSYSTVGLCSRCVDVTSLVVQSKEYPLPYKLPNGLWVGWQPPDTWALSSDIFNPDGEPEGSDHLGHINWAGDLVPPEAEFSFRNLTILALTRATCKQDAYGSIIRGTCPPLDPNQGIVAATCSIYPCMRTFIASVINGDLNETEIASVPLKPAVISGMDPTDGIFDVSGQVEVDLTDEGYKYPLVGVKTPCRSKDGAGVYTAQNMSLAPNTTSVHICDKLQANGRYNTTNISAPPECIYIHPGVFGSSISKYLGTILAGNCSLNVHSPETPYCDSAQVGTDGWLYNLYHNHTATFGTIESYMDSVTSAMTNFYRRELGSSDYDVKDNPREDLTPGIVLGAVWKLNVCTSIQWEWLAMPASLAFLTIVLLAWTVIRSWTHRYDEPVWKDNVLPAVLYRERFETMEGHVVGPIGSIPSAQAVSRDRVEQRGRLAETAEMERMAKNMLVSFRLPEARSDGNQLLQTRPRRLSLDSLLTSQRRQGGI